MPITIHQEKPDQRLRFLVSPQWHSPTMTRWIIELQFVLPFSFPTLLLLEGEITSTVSSFSDLVTSSKFTSEIPPCGVSGVGSLSGLLDLRRLFLDTLRESFLAPTDAIHIGASSGFQSILVLNMTKNRIREC